MKESRSPYTKYPFDRTLKCFAGPLKLASNRPEFSGGWGQVPQHITILQKTGFYIKKPEPFLVWNSLKFSTTIPNG